MASTSKPTTPPPQQPKPDLSRDLDHNGIVDASDDRSRDLDRDGVIGTGDRQEKDLNRDNKIDGSDQTKQEVPKVGTVLGYTKDGESWTPPEQNNKIQQQQTIRPKLG
ncbi:hypothetical protein DES53_106386 [Roseimicrobium gellanilyticum]|uniref:Uncharacterized protein n=1 Tax=Roseimicrobium gellanilyticum TaxID=748857 RepID=A0A366HIT6_9BACT|nr:hypothetical protein [Roseimicrobium gellanilyticum]RBP42677.1 hypothetical protein DES53_106386 [Roseimicrobium gellanilyticum]